MRIVRADCPVQRLTGYIGRRPPPDAALHLSGTRSVHTFGVRGRLDLVWVDGDGRVVRVDRDVAPGRVRTCRRARSVYECRVGGADRLLSQL